MAASNTETLLLQVDIVANNARLAELAQQARVAKEEFATLKKTVQATSGDMSLVDAASVKLKATLAANNQEARVLTKANTDQMRVLQAEEGSIEQLRAQLSLGTAAYNALSKAERDTTEEGQRLQAGNKALSDNLKVLEAAIGDTRRNVGNYSGALSDLIPQLVKLQEQQKAAAPDSAAYKEAARQIGFVQKAAEEAGAKMGLSAEQANAKLAKTAEAIRPATAELVRLEAEQAKVDKGSDAYTQIGFKVGKLNKEIAQAPQALEKVEAASQGAASGLQSAISKGLAPFQGQIDKVTGTVAKFKSGTELLNTGLASLKGGGETGALGFRAIAAGIAATGIGLLLIAITSLIGYLTQTAEGGKILKQVLAGVGAVTTTLSNAVFEAGKYLTKLFTDPKQVASDFIDFLKGQVVNRLLAFGVLLDGIRNRDFKKITDSVIQFNLGITNGTDKIAAYGKGIRDNVVGMAELEAQMQKLKKSRAELEIDEVKEKGRVEELIRLSKDRTLTSGQRLDKLREAGRIEEELSAKALAQTQAELEAIQQRNKAKGLTRTSDEIQEERDKRKEYNATVAERNSTLATIKARQSRYILEQRAEETKAAEDAVKEKIAVTEAQLLTVKQGSEQELELRKQLTLQQAELERVAANKTAADRKLITAKSLVELLKQEDEFLKARQELVAKQAAQEDAGRVTAYNAEQKRKEEAKKEQEDAYKRDEAMLDRYLNARATEIENNYAEGKTSKADYERSLRILEESNYGGRIALQKVYNKDSSKLEAEQAARHRGVLVATREAEKKLNDDRLKNAEQIGREVGQLFAEVLLTQGESLQEFTGKLIVLLIDSLEKVTLAAAAEASAKSIAMNPTPAGFLQAAVTSALIVAGFETAKGIITATTAKPFAANTGGMVPGYGNTDTVPAILTPGEIVMNKAASAELAPVLSYLNSLYGGVNFAPGFTPAQAVSRTFDGGLMARQIGGGQQIDYQKLADSLSAVQLDVGVRTIDRAKQQYNRPRGLTSLN